MDSMNSLVPVIVKTLVVDILPAPSVVVLRPQQEDVLTERVLPIWIGPAEAASIGIALEGQTRLRPMTHDFLANAIYALGSSVERVVIDRVEGTTFYATVYLQRDGHTINLDARPSDSIALALRMNVPLFVDEDVFNAASYPYDFSDVGNREVALSEFHTFIESVSPEDFSL